jgi:CHAT domain-containing protein/tetratricopeptide (TPR) repeat protein
VRGDLIRAQHEAERACHYYSKRDVRWWWKFRILKAKILAWRGMFEDVLDTLDAKDSPSIDERDLLVQRDVLISTADVHLHRFSEAQAYLNLPTRACAESTSIVCSELLGVRGHLEVEQGRYDRALSFFEQSLNLANQQHDRFSQATALLNLSYLALQQERFDEAMDRAQSAYDAARVIDGQRIMLTAEGNLGWAHYRTGDPETALGLLLQAAERAEQMGAIDNQVAWLTNAGYIYLDQGNFAMAEGLYRKALDLANEINSKEDIVNAQISLAFVCVLTGKLDLARQYSEQVTTSSHQDGNRLDELYALLSKGQAAVRTGDVQRAEQIFSEVSKDPQARPSLKWEAQHELADLYAGQHETTKAEAAYRTTLTTFETARSSIQHEDVKLPFLANASSLYEDYISFLLGQGKTAEALSVADHARARTLSEGLGQLRKTESPLPRALDAQRIARTAGGNVLYYFLGQEQSYLWAITPQNTSLFQLPAAATIDAAVKRYRKALERPQEGIEAQNPDGVELYRMLVQPAEPVMAQPVMAKSAKVFILPDGSLNGLNFEALVVPGPKPHYWIEDVTIANASSLRLLASSRPSAMTSSGKLLLVGNPMAASPAYVTPPQAGAEMSDVGGHFPAANQVVFSGQAATPEAYLASRPEQFSYIHFVAHGTASRLTPLDSAIVLSSATGDDSFRLYARDIIQHPLRADLVTISACYGAGSRAYSGEGLVGLSWAFLRAGAHNVIGALWDVSDASTPQLMDRMYAEIRKGRRPEEALRIAKLSLLHSDNAFRKPFYWAPFQFYTGS